MSTTIRNREDPTLTRLLKHMAAVRDLWPQVVALKYALQYEQPALVRETWEALSPEDKHALWIAPTFGGIWTTRERKLLREWQSFNHSEALPRAVTASPTAGGAGSED